MEKSKKAKIIGNTIFFSIITIMVTFFVWNFIDIKSGYKYPIFGLRKSVIVSPSMATVNEANDYITPEMKQIKQYDVVTTTQYKSFDSIKQYDIATYFSGSKNLICHRVVDKYIDENGNKYVVFRGDANNTNDTPVSYSLVRGKVVSISRGTGHFVAFIQSPYFFIAIFGTVFFVALGMFIADKNKENKKVAATETEAGQPKETPATDETQTEEQVEDNPNEAPVEETPMEEKPAEEEPAEEKPEEATEQPSKEPAQDVEEQSNEEPQNEEEQPKEETRVEESAPQEEKNDAQNDTSLDTEQAPENEQEQPAEEPVEKDKTEG